MAKPIEFPPSDPIIVRINKDKGFWDIEVAPGHQAMMNKRGRGPSATGPRGDMPNLDNEYQSRRAAGAPPLPHFKMDPHHTPIVMREGESVRFKCDPPMAFAVFADRDGSVSAAPNTPSDPFDWKLPQSAPPGVDIDAKVLMPVGNIGPADQRFYKFTAWIFDNVTKQTITVDPDGYCDR